MKYIKLFEAHNNEEANKIFDWKNNDFIYRAETEGKLLEDCYGESFMSKNKGIKAFDVAKKHDTDYKIIAEYKDEKTDKYCSCWTLDKDYRMAAFNESKIRIALDVKKILDSKLEDRIFYGGGKPSEMEIRIEGSLEDWPKYLAFIETSKEFYNDGEEFEDVFFPPLKKWLPEELNKFVKFIPEKLFWDSSANGKNLCQKYNISSYVDLGLR